MKRAVSFTAEADFESAAAADAQPRLEVAIVARPATCASSRVW